MSRIGKMPIPIPKDVKVDLKGDLLTINGPKGRLERNIHPKINVNLDNDQITVSVNDEGKESRSFHGLFRALIVLWSTIWLRVFQKDMKSTSNWWVWATGLSCQAGRQHFIWDIPIRLSLIYRMESRPRLIRQKSL